MFAVQMLKTLITNLIGMLMTKAMILWGLKFAAKQTKNKIDDDIVLLVEGAYDNDEEKVRAAIEALAAEIQKSKEE